MENQTFKVKAVIRQNLCKLKAQPEELTLHYFSMLATYDRNIQFITNPANSNYDSISEIEKKKGYRYISVIDFFIRKLQKNIRTELICYIDKGITKGCKFKYIINIYDIDKNELLFTQDIKPYTNTGAPITSIIGYGSKPTIFYSVNHEYTGKNIFNIFKEYLNI